ncbi:MAG: polysaccharide biosynthesis protein, partial [Pseudomonadota bacterium]|nr:polysaccharide biosynthesis protein [Pseudomonadota bacterium]
MGRPQTTLDRDMMQSLVGSKNILVTGSGGSIGSELVRQIIALKPASITLYDNSEFQLYQIDQEMAETFPDIPRYTVLGDVRDETRIEQVFKARQPQLVFHAAALKHVPMVEQNPMEGVLTNVAGSRNVADACARHKISAMVLISTDKAVNPTNIMGATKRIAESYCQALDLNSNEDSSTRFVTVRFGNVLGSTGSVVPLFQRQLAAGGPLTVTHKDVTRYFMTTKEAVELVLQATALATSDKETTGRL